MSTPTTDRIAGLDLPTHEEEDWRYSRIDDLEMARFSREATKPSEGPPPELLDVITSAVGPAAAIFVISDGYVTATDVRHPRLASSVGERIAESPSPVDAFGRLHEEVAQQTLIVDVPAGVAIEEPVVVLNWLGADGVTSFPHVVVRTGEAAEVTVVDWQASADIESLVIPQVELHAGAASNIRYLNVQDLGPRVVQMGRQFSTARRDATVVASTVALGGSYARLRTDALLDGQGSTVNLVAVYFGADDQMHDFRSLQDHVAEHTTSHLLFKGAVAGTAHGVYSGLIRVRAGAKGSDSFLANRNLVLSPDARVDSVPNLEIINENDLRNCGHASATGPIDEDHRFYLESRGVPTEVAERLIILGFFDEVMERMPVPSLRPLLRQAIAAKYLASGLA